MELVIKHLEFELERIETQIELLNEEDTLIKRLFAFQEPLTYLEKVDKMYLLSKKKEQFETAIKTLKDA